MESERNESENKSDLLVLCCVCGKKRIGDSWKPYNATLGEQRNASHTYCPPCYEKAMNEMDAFKYPTVENEHQ